MTSPHTSYHDKIRCTTGIPPKGTPSGRLTSFGHLRGSRYDDNCISEIVLLDESGEDILADRDTLFFPRVAITRDTSCSIGIFRESIQLITVSNPVILQ